MPTVTMADMAKRKKHPDPTPVEPVSQSEESKGRTEDRHASPFMTRLPEIYRTQLRKYQDKHYKEHRFRPPMTAVLQLALEEFLTKHGLWPPPEGTPEGE